MSYHSACLTFEQHLRGPAEKHAEWETMGLDATVRCRCWEEGRCTPCSFAELVRLDDEGYLNLELPWESRDGRFREFNLWKKTCCPHENMEYANEHISNWTGYRLFQQRLEEIGWQHFPTLQAELPQANGGLMGAAAAAAALRELEVFGTVTHHGHDTMLIDALDGAELHQHIEAYDGVFVWGGKAGANLGVDSDGFSVLSRADDEHARKELFRAREFEQEHVEEQVMIFRDVESGNVFRCAAGVTRPERWPDGKWTNQHGRVNQTYPRHLKVVKKPRTPQDLDYITTPLRRIFHASVETGNPVRWC